MTGRNRFRRHLAVVAVLVAASGAAATWPATGSGPSPVGSWGFSFDASVGGAEERTIGTLLLAQAAGLRTCTIEMRAVFGGHAHDHRSTTCEWSLASESAEGAANGLTGAVVATGITGDGPMRLSFVLTDGARRMLLLLDDTLPGVIGSGEAFRN